MWGGHDMIGVAFDSLAALLAAFVLAHTYGYAV